MAIELWHLIVSGATGLSAIAFLFMRLKAITTEYKDNAIKEALKWQEYTTKLLHLEANIARLDLDFKDIMSNISSFRSENAQQHAELVEQFTSKIDKLRETVYESIRK